MVWPFNSSFAHFQIDPESDEEGDVKLDIKTRKEIKLYRCSDENGSYEILEVKSGPLDQQDLLSKDSFIIDNGIFGIWAWIGKGWRISKQIFMVFNQTFNSSKDKHKKPYSA